MPAPSPRSRILSPGRIAVISGHTLTLLVRMKVFYFLAFFALIVVASNFFSIQDLGHPDMQGADTLRTIRSWSLGAMTLYAIVIGIVATALLIPRDVEDRTLYTILAKPVPRLDYLIGKLGGVLLLLFLSLAAMNALTCGVLHLRTQQILAEQMQAASLAGWPPSQIEALREETLRQGITWSLQGAVWSIFLRAAVISSAALLISALSTSTLFTTIITFLLYFIGSFIGDARDFYLALSEPGVTFTTQATYRVLSSIIPDFQVYNVVDAIIEGKSVTLSTIGSLTGLTLSYVASHLLATWLIFAKKEF